ncbi:MAG: phosphoribosylglycinamide formyltransferase, partial [Spirochaetaceae bacterium]|nr:phosphoribosylglycinamide formyltransferase [Spirochaetaceae bacterium]
MNAVVLVSGNGSNLQALVDAEKAGRFGVHIAAVVSDRAG